MEGGHEVRNHRERDTGIEPPYINGNPLYR